jgi:hypothetical protein
MLSSFRVILKKHATAGFHVDDRLWHEIDQPGEMFLDLLATKEEFLKVVWQSTDATRPLAPVGEARTLFNCASRLSTFGWEFQTSCQIRSR